MLEIELHGFENTQRVHVTTSLVFNVIKASTIDDCRQQTEILSFSLRFQVGRDHDENTRHVIKAPKISFGNSRLLKKFVQFIYPNLISRQDESDSTNRSSFGLLPKECLEATQATVDETFEWTMSKSSLKMPPILQKTSSKKDVISPKESDSISIGDQYLKPTLERLTKEEADETTPLDLLLGSTMGKYIIISFMIMNEESHYRVPTQLFSR